MMEWYDFVVIVVADGKIITRNLKMKLESCVCAVLSSGYICMIFF